MEKAVKMELTERPADRGQGFKSRFKVAKVAFATDPPASKCGSVDILQPIQDEDILAEVSPPTSPSQDRGSCDEVTFGYSDTHNLKTFGHNTHEALPHVDHYRNLLSATHALRSRPTLEELHDLDQDEMLLDNLGSDVENGKTSKTVDNDKVKVETANSKPAPRFGWIKGVLIRCLLNIWGVMLFIRLSWVVGQAGIGFATVIILLSGVVTTITALSMSAICTNGVVRGGGAYFMISRSLGPEFGGAIGMIFSVANAVAVAMYVVGFAETVRDLMQAHDAVIVDSVNDVRIIGALTLVLVVIVAMVGMEWEARAQVVLLFVLLIALIDYAVGTIIPPTDFKKSRGFYGYQGRLFLENIGPQFEDGESFFSVFAVFFPAATGILAGANISGDLADAQRDIPKGTLLAILLSTIVYLIMAWSCGMVAIRHAAGIVLTASNDSSMSAADMGLFWDTSTKPGNVQDEICKASKNCTYGLTNNFQMMEMISGFGPIITAGIFSATLSSALASLVGAPKVFQAVCNDRIFPKLHVFGKGYGNGNEPRRAYALAFIIALGFITVGELNAIAPIISNFFLMAYALINYSCFDASLAKSPGWRPAFRFYSMWLSLFGGLLCLGVMFVINWWTALLTFVIVAGLYVYVHYSKPDVNWGSSTQAHVYKNALQSALKLVQVLDHIKNFRPQILVLSGFPRSRPALVDFASNINKNISLLICGHVVVGESPSRSKTMNSFLTKGYDWLARRKLKAFYAVISAPNFRYGAQSLLQSVGVGKLRPNTLLMGFKNNWQKDDPERVLEYFNVIHDAFDLRFGVGILRLEEGFDLSTDIDDTSEDEEDMSDNDSDTGSAAEIPANREQVNIPLSPCKETKKPVVHASTDITFPKPRTMIANQMLTNKFHKKQKKGTIDVWWLFDDGGLTILIPYILSTKSQWRNNKLRVFSAGTKKHQLDNDQRHMATLLSKFRIDYSSVTILPSVGKRPQEASIDEFDRITESWMLDESDGQTHETHPWKISDADIRTHRDKTFRHIRLHELLLEHSTNASLIVMTLPMPRKSTVPAGLYMAWIEILSSGLPPILLLRGNQQSVLTYYS